MEKTIYGYCENKGRHELYTEDKHLEQETKTNKTWIDGKTIYRKVIKFIPTETSGSKSYDVNNVENVVKLDGFMYYNSGNVLPLNFSYNQEGETVYWFYKVSPEDGDIKYEISSLYINKAVCVILEYTKTTD